jgi:hypothetical protein
MSGSRLLRDLIAAAEHMAVMLDEFSKEGGLIAVSAEGDPVFHMAADPKRCGGYGLGATREWRRLLEDAQREGLVP